MNANLNPYVLQQENCTFRMALADIAHAYPKKVTVEKLQEIALSALEKHRERKEPTADGHGDLFDNAEVIGCLRAPMPEDAPRTAAGSPLDRPVGPVAGA